MQNRTIRYNESRYRILNIHNLLSGRQPTIELRAFNGSLHSGKLRAYILLVLKLVERSNNITKASYKITESPDGNDKWSFRIWLLKLGFIGEEFKNPRKHLTKNLNGNSAWRNPLKEVNYTREYILEEYEIEDYYPL